MCEHLLVSAHEGPYASSREVCLSRWLYTAEMIRRQITAGKAKGKLSLTLTYLRVLVLRNLQFSSKNVRLFFLNRDLFSRLSFLSFDFNYITLWLHHFFWKCWKRITTIIIMTIAAQAKPMARARKCRSERCTVCTTVSQSSPVPCCQINIRWVLHLAGVCPIIINLQLPKDGDITLISAPIPYHPPSPWNSHSWVWRDPHGSRK